MSDQEITRLYGLEHAEVLYRDIDTVWEAELELFADAQSFKPWIVEEWTVHDPKYHFPTAAHVIDQIFEWVDDTGEVSENWSSGLGPHAHEFIDKAEELIDLMASKVTYRMADKRVATHELELKGTDLYVNGKLWRKDAVT